MRTLIFVSLLLGAASTAAYSQTELATDKDGLVNVQTLTCAQLANTFQEDADALAMYYAGWYNGLAKKHGFNAKRTRALQHEVIVYCKEHQDRKVIQAMDLVFKGEQAGKK
jgi:cytoplasmic iron level regulating protein YaaA (DUF328/UPF0246 family)